MDEVDTLLVVADVVACNYVIAGMAEVDTMPPFVVADVVACNYVIAG